jgi:hypothetical protein
MPAPRNRRDSFATTAIVSSAGWRTTALSTGAAAPRPCRRVTGFVRKQPRGRYPQRSLSRLLRVEIGSVDVLDHAARGFRSFVRAEVLSGRFGRLTPISRPPQTANQAALPHGRLAQRVVRPP